MPSRRTVAGWVAAAVLASATVVVASGELGVISGPGHVRSPAERVVAPAALGDVVAVSQVGALGAPLSAAVAAATTEAGGRWAPSRSAMVGMVALRRGNTTVQAPPDGFRYPMVVTAMPLDAVGAVMGDDVARTLDVSTIVVGELTAGLRGARAGDVVDLVAADGSVRSFTIGLVAPDPQVGGTEIVMSAQAADRLGVTRESRAVIWGFESRTAIDLALARHGVADRRETRVSRSWDPPGPDATLGTARTKEMLGEFAYRIEPDGTIEQDAEWVTTNLPAARQLLNDSIPVRARCHQRVVADLRAALAAVAAAGLSSAIDVSNANTFGGCHNARFNRISAEFGFLSRHAWAMAFDTNTVANCQGCVPVMDCRVVVIFRRHNFAWGGNFLRPDGMHFEWVGERRDRVSTRPAFCPNPGPLVSNQRSAGRADSRNLLFADVVDHDRPAGP